MAIKWKCLVFIFVFIMSNTVVMAQNEIGTGQEEITAEEKVQVERGRIIRIIEDTQINLGESIDDPDGSGFEVRYQLVEIEITTGQFTGRVVEVENYIDVHNMVVGEGYEVLLYLEEDEGGALASAFIMEIARDKYLVYLVIAFVLVLVIVGGLKGLKTVITLTITGIAVVKILLPLLLKGYSPILLSIGVCALISLITLLIVSGFNKKTWAAIAGTTGGVLVAGIVAWTIGSMANLTGLGNEEAQMLMFVPSEVQFDFRGLLFSGIILGALGAVMDVSMSVASAMSEIREHNSGIRPTSMIKSGMNVGKDMMGTMSNTLILAYVGGSLHLMLLFLAYDVPFSEIINRDMIASEVVRALAGSIGLISAIPITAVVMAGLGAIKNRLRGARL